MAKRPADALLDRIESLQEWRGLGLALLVAFLVVGVLAIGIARARKTADANFEAGLSALAQEDYATAVRRFEAVAGAFFAPHRKEARFFLAAARQGLGQNAKAVEAYEEIVAEGDPLLAPLAARNRILAYEAMGDLAAARAAAEEAVAKFGDAPQGPWIRLEAARVLRAAGDTDAAARVVAPVLSHTAETDPVRAILPWAYALAGGEGSP